MKLEKFTAENGYFTLMLQLCLNSLVFPKNEVEYVTFSVIKIKLYDQIIFSIIFYKKVSDFELK